MSRIKREKQQSPVLGIVGKIKVGKRNAKGFPEALDYFRFTDSVGGRHAKLAKAALGEKPKQLLVTFSSDDHQQNCINRLELRNKGGNLVAYTDLETLWTSQKDGFEPIAQSRIDAAGGIKKCMELLEQQNSTNKYEAKFFECLYLRVVLLEVGVVGEWELYTKAAKSSIKQIVDTYDLMLKNAGRVTFVPFRLSVQKVKSNRVIPGSSYQRVYSVVSLIPDLSIEMQEKILAFGDQIRGLVTTAKLNEIESGKTLKQLPVKSEFVEYEEV